MSMHNPRRCEVWIVDFNPTKGVEIQKQRPAIVISSDALGKLPLKIVAPITGWRENFSSNIWHVQLKPSSENGLSKESAVDILQVRSVDTSRFMSRLGYIREAQMEEIVQALAAVIELT